MKKIILSLVLVFGCLTFANAQQNALGLKNSMINSNGMDISYQRWLCESNRLEFNLGLSDLDTKHGTDFSFSAAYQWVFDLDQLATGFKWYVGAGAAAGLFTHKDLDSQFRLAAIGNLGIEYNFKFPLQLAIDYTPTLSITPSFGDFYGEDRSVRFAARWRF
jgi:hypothetical protein